jgi:hypothetical protein
MPTFDEHLAHGDRTTEPRVPWITDFSRLSFMGVGLSTCTIAAGRISDSAKTRRTGDPSYTRRPAESWRSLKSAASTTTTNAGLHRHRRRSIRASSSYASPRIPSRDPALTPSRGLPHRDRQWLRDRRAPTWISRNANSVGGSRFWRRTGRSLGNCGVQRLTSSRRLISLLRSRDSTGSTAPIDATMLASITHPSLPGADGST